MLDVTAADIFCIWWILYQSVMRLFCVCCIFYFEGFRPEWCISTIYHAWYTILVWDPWILKAFLKDTIRCYLSLSIMEGQMEVKIGQGNLQTQNGKIQKNKNKTKQPPTSWNLQVQFVDGRIMCILHSKSCVILWSENSSYYNGGRVEFQGIFLFLFFFLFDCWTFTVSQRALLIDLSTVLVFSLMKHGCFIYWKAKNIAWNVEISTLGCEAVQ